MTMKLSEKLTNTLEFFLLFFCAFLCANFLCYLNCFLHICQPLSYSDVLGGGFNMVTTGLRGGDRRFRKISEEQRVATLAAAAAAGQEQQHKTPGFKRVQWQPRRSTQSQQCVLMPHCHFGQPICICPNCKMYLSKLMNIFAQFAKNISIKLWDTGQQCVLPHCQWSACRYHQTNLNQICLCNR